jgi:hypothetical protein
MTKELEGYRVAILVADGFEESEMVQPRQALELAGATTHIIFPEKGSVRSESYGNWRQEYAVDVLLDNADPADYDALLLTSGPSSGDGSAFCASSRDTIPALTARLSIIRIPYLFASNFGWPPE